MNMLKHICMHICKVLNMQILTSCVSDSLKGILLYSEDLAFIYAYFLFSVCFLTDSSAFFESLPEECNALSGWYECKVGWVGA